MIQVYRMWREKKKFADRCYVHLKLVEKVLKKIMLTVALSLHPPTIIM
jgi:hypothetical protein